MIDFYFYVLKSKIRSLCLVIIFLSLVFETPFAICDTVHFDSNGNVVDKIHYEILVAEREKIIRVKLRNGYGSDSNVWRDPIKLRKKRILQWQILRSLYNPGFLPENLTSKNWIRLPSIYGLADTGGQTCLLIN